MRKEPFDVGNYVHAIKRGARGAPIVLDDGDRWRFLLMLFHFNDVFSIPDNWFRILMDLKIANTFKRPPNWPERKPLTKILAFCLLDNHFHLLLKETRKDGIAMFMKKLCGGMTLCFNSKHKEKGSLFQGAYKSKTINDDRYLRYVAAYIQVKNAFDMYPNGGYEKTEREFEKAYKWATEYPYCSLGDYAGVRQSPILDKELLGEIFSGPGAMKSFAEDFIAGRGFDLEIEEGGKNRGIIFFE